MFISQGLRWGITLFLIGMADAPPIIFGAAAPVAPDGGTVNDLSGFIEAVEAKSLEAKRVGAIHQDFFRAEGTTLRISGGLFSVPAELQLFEYDDKTFGKEGLKTAAEDARQIEPTGDPRTMRVRWIDPPHFFHKNRLIVLYLGSDTSALALLTELLGTQFAGR